MRIPRNQRSWAEPGLAGQREPTPPLARHPSEEGMGAVPLLGGVAEGRGGFLFASHVDKGGVRGIFRHSGPPRSGSPWVKRSSHFQTGAGPRFEHKDRDGLHFCPLPYWATTGGCPYICLLTFPLRGHGAQPGCPDREMAKTGTPIRYNRTGRIRTPITFSPRPVQNIWGRLTRRWQTRWRWVRWRSAA